MHRGCSLKFRPTVGLALAGVLASQSVAGAAADPGTHFNQLFGDRIQEVGQTRDTTDDIRLAGEILDRVHAVADMPALQVLFYEKAYELAAKDGAGCPIAVRAMEGLANLVPERKSECDQKILDAYRVQLNQSKGPERAAAAETYLAQNMLVVADMLTVRDYDSAERLYTQALPIATAINWGQKDLLVQELRNVREQRKAQRRAQALVEGLNTSSDNAAAHRELVELNLLLLGDLEQARASAAKAGDALLPKVVETFAAGDEASDPNACLTTAKWFDTQASRQQTTLKQAALLQAQRFYQRYLAIYTARDAVRLQAEMALAEVESAIGRSGLVRRTESADSESAGNTWSSPPAAEDNASSGDSGRTTSQGTAPAVAKVQEMFAQLPPEAQPGERTGWAESTGRRAQGFLRDQFLNRQVQLELTVQKVGMPELDPKNNTWLLIVEYKAAYQHRGQTVMGHLTFEGEEAFIDRMTKISTNQPYRVRGTLKGVYVQGKHVQLDLVEPQVTTAQPSRRRW